ncbi:MAG TPA: AraC family transcriptional regulator [Pyrinomonadaceae bacterium]
MDSKLQLSGFHQKPLNGLDGSGFKLRIENVHGFRLAESAYPPGYEHPKHSHEYGCFYLLLEGSLTERFGKKSRECEPMSMVFNHPGEEHSDSFHRTGGRNFVLEMDRDRLAVLREHSLVLDQSAQFYGGLLAWLGIRVYNEFRRMDSVSPLVIESLGVEIMAEISRSAKRDERKPPIWLERTREFLHENFAESLSLSEVAAIAEVHPVHLVRVFRSFYRCTIGEYVRRLRVEFASRELSRSDLPLATIASSAGFSDQSHLSRTFKQHTGLSPSEFRAAFRLR